MIKYSVSSKVIDDIYKVVKVYDKLSVDTLSWTFHGFQTVNFMYLFYPKLLQNLETLVLNGNFGDSIMNKQFREIISYVKEHGTKVLIHTNGGIHNDAYWSDVGRILKKGDIINFDLA